MTALWLAHGKNQGTPNWQFLFCTRARYACVWSPYSVVMAIDEAFINGVLVGFFNGTQFGATAEKFSW